MAANDPHRKVLKCKVCDDPWSVRQCPRCKAWVCTPMYKDCFSVHKCR